MEYSSKMYKGLFAAGSSSPASYLGRHNLLSLVQDSLNEAPKVTGYRLLFGLNPHTPICLHLTRSPFQKNSGGHESEEGEPGHH